LVVEAIRVTCNVEPADHWQPGCGIKRVRSAPVIVLERGPRPCLSTRGPGFSGLAYDLHISRARLVDQTAAATHAANLDRGSEKKPY